jgi:hypothetical protein
MRLTDNEIRDIRQYLEQGMLFVEEDGFMNYKPESFEQLAGTFQKFKTV